MKERYENKHSYQYAVKPKTDYDKDFVESITMTPACQKAFDELSKGDASPFQFIQELKFGEKYPASDGSIYTKEWVESYLDVLQKAPITGSKDGHTAMNSYMERVSNEIYMIGAKIESDDTVLLRHYITREMPEYEYNRLTKEMKAGLLSTSVFSFTKFKVIVDENEHSEKWYAIESVGNERNDIVEWNQTGMSSGVVATAQKAKIIDKEVNVMDEITLDMAIEKIKKDCDTLGVDKRVIAQKLGLGDLVLTDAIAQKLNKFDELESKTGGIEDFVIKSVQSQKDNFKAMKEIELSKVFNDNPVVMSVVSDIIGETPVAQKELIEKIESATKLESVKNLVAHKLDMRNQVHGSGEKNVTETVEFTV